MLHPMREQLAKLARGHPAGSDFERFFDQLMAVDPAERLTASEALQHPYMECIRLRLAKAQET